MAPNPGKLILIAEPVHFGDTHVQVNSAFVALFRHIYAQHQLQLVAEKKHIEAIRANAGHRIGEISTRSFAAYSRPGLFYWPQKILGEWRQIFSIVRAARKSKPELLVWLCLFPTGHLLLQCLSRIYLRGQRQLIVLHGELEYLKPQQKSLADQFLHAVLKKALSGAGSRVSYFVLGESIKTNLLQYAARVAAQVCVVDHPYLYDAPVQAQRSGAPALRICTFGTLKRAKNTQLFFEMAGRFGAEIGEGKLSFTTIGKLSPDLQVYQSAAVRHYKPSEFIPQKEYEQEIRQYDLALFFYDNEAYSLTASGVLHECIRLGMPFLALQNDYFYALIRRHGAGALFHSVEDMESYIRSLLINADSQWANNFRASIFSFIQENSFLLQSEKLKKVLEHQGLYTV
ncbi:MAG: hypothetical protein JNL13_10240 [Chitinophagaceae bacterium]|nr:hypothetical protein [Chitinophagaceae bacterium]